MSAPVYGCPGCETSAGSMGCSIHRQRTHGIVREVALFARSAVERIAELERELAEERAVWEWLEQQRTEAIKKWRLTGFLPTVLLLHQYCAPPRDNVVQLAEVQSEQTIRAAIDKARKGL